MPHPDEARLIKDLEDWNLQAAAEFKKCRELAKNWRGYSDLQYGSDDAFSNVMNNSGCNANLNRWLSSKDGFLQRAYDCLNYYRKQL